MHGADEEQPQGQVVDVEEPAFALNLSGRAGIGGERPRLRLIECGGGRIAWQDHLHPVREAGR